MRVKPRSARAGIAGERGGAVVVRVTEPPVDGRANAALVKLIAKRAGVAKGRVRITSGQRSHEKVVRVAGLSLGGLRRALGLDPGPGPSA